VFKAMEDPAKPNEEWQDSTVWILHLSALGVSNEGLGESSNEKIEELAERYPDVKESVYIG